LHWTYWTHLSQAKSAKITLIYLERGKHLLQNGMLHFVFWISQLSEIVRIYVNEKPTFLKKAPYFKG